MTDDDDTSVIGHMMQSEDELMATVAELWMMVQHHDRKIESLEEQIGIRRGRSDDLETSLE